MEQQSQKRHYEIDATRMEMKHILKALCKGRMRAYRILLFITFFLLFAGIILTVLLMYDGFDDAALGAIVIFGLPGFLLGIIAFACYEALICKYFKDNEWINLYTLYETRYYTTQNYFFRILTGDWFLIENAPDAYVGYKVEDESFIETETFITDLNEISKNLNLHIDFSELPLNEKNETDLNAVNDFIASKNHTMLTMYDADASLCLFVLPNDTDPERVSRLCDRAGIRF